MKICVFSTFWNPLKQDTFTAQIKHEQQVIEYRGEYEAGSWSFKLFDESGLILESRQKTLPKRETFLGHQDYQILLKGSELADLNRRYTGKRIIFMEREYPFPKFFERTIPDLNLTFPMTAWVHRRKVRSTCTSPDETKQFLSIAMTIFIWFTWNAIPAD